MYQEASSAPESQRCGKNCCVRTISICPGQLTAEPVWKGKCGAPKRAGAESGRSGPFSRFSGQVPSDRTSFLRAYRLNIGPTAPGDAIHFEFFELLAGLSLVPQNVWLLTTIDVQWIMVLDIHRPPETSVQSGPREVPVPAKPQTRMFIGDTAPRSTGRAIRLECLAESLVHSFSEVPILLVVSFSGNRGNPTHAGLDPGVARRDDASLKIDTQQAVQKSLRCAQSGLGRGFVIPAWTLLFKSIFEIREFQFVPRPSTGPAPANL